MKYRNKTIGILSINLIVIVGLTMLIFNLRVVHYVVTIFFAICFILISIINFDIHKRNKSCLNIKEIEQKILYLEEYNLNLKKEIKLYNDELNNIKGRFDNLSYEEINEYHMGNEFKITGIPPLDSLLKLKSLEGQKLGINMNFCIEPIENNILDAVEICSIVGNLLNNAIYYIKDYNHKEITLNIRSDEFLIILLENPIHKIENNSIKLFFEKGFTTKGEDGDGMGLYIVKKIVEGYRGKIEAIYTNERIKFYIEIKNNI